MARSVSPATKKVHVKVENDLSATTLHVDMEFVTGSVDPVLTSYVLGLEKHSGHNQRILLGEVIHASYMLFGYHKEMDRCGWVNVFENYKAIILINKIGFSLAPHNLTKSALITHVFPIGYILTNSWQVNQQKLLLNSRLLYFNAILCYEKP